MALGMATLKLGEEDMTLGLDATLPPTPGKGCLLRTLSSQGRAEAGLQWTKTPKKIVEEAGGMRCSLSMPAEAGPRKHTPFLKQTFRMEPVDSTPAYPAGSGKMREIVVREADLRKYGSDLRKLSQVQVRPNSPSTASGKKDFDLSFKSAFALRCRGGTELRDPWQGMKNPEFSREQSEQDLVLNQVWVNAMQPRKKLYDLNVSPRPEEGAGGSSPKSPQKPEEAAATLMPPLPSTGSSMGPAASRRRQRRRTACLCQHRNCLSCAQKAADGMTSSLSCCFEDRPWSRETASSMMAARSTTRRRTGGSTASSEAAMKKVDSKVESRIKNIDEVFGAEDEEDQSLVGSMAVRAATKLQKANMRKISDRLYYDETPRAAWLAVNADTGDVTFYHRDVAQRLESAFRSGRQSVPLEGLGREMDGTIVTFPHDKTSTRIIETSISGKRRELTRIGVPGTTRDLVVATVREGGVWRFAGDGDCEHAARLAAKAGEDPEEDFVYQEKKLALTGQEIVMPENNKLPPVNRNQRVYYINPTFTEYY